MLRESREARHSPRGWRPTHSSPCNRLCPGALVATCDHNINPYLKRSMAKRAGSDTIEVPASHAVYVSKPNEVARLIERAAMASGQ